MKIIITMKGFVSTVKDQISISMGQGFTLVELIIVFAVIGLITSLGVASLASYGNRKTVESASMDVADMLTLARSRALSQVKPPECGSVALTGYRVDIDRNSGQYGLTVLCGSAYQINVKTLPQNVSFASGSTTSVTFPLLTGSPLSSSQVLITGYGSTKTIHVNTTGNVWIDN